jgi:hypothetical protein
VAGAEVLYRDLGPDVTPEQRNALAHPVEIEALLAGGSPIERRTDDTGRARVPAPNGPVVAIARSGDRFGCAGVHDTGVDRVRIRIGPDWSLPIQVVDSAGRPVVGVPVALRQRGAWRIDEPVVVRTEAPDGIGRVPHAGARIAASAANGIWLAAVQAVLREPLEREIDPSVTPSEPVVLVLPETGSVDVQVLEADGQPYSDLAQVHLAAAGPGPAGEPAAAISRGGRARYDFVELGLDLRASANRLRSGPGRAEATGPGPRAAGESIALTLRLGGSGTVLQARVVTPDGAPVATRDLHAALRDPTDSMAFLVRTDADGRIRFDLATHVANRGALTLTVRDPLDGRAALGATVPAGTPPGIHDLGELVLGSAPLLSAGAVVDAQGAPVPRAAIRLQVRELRERNGEQILRWQTLYDFVARSGPDGRFELRGELDAAQPILVSARRNGYVADGVECRVGQSDVCLVLARGGRIAGKLLVDPGATADALWIELIEPSLSQDVGASELGARVRCAPEPSGYFELVDLAAGSYTLRVNPSAAGRGPLVELHGLVVAAGEPCADPRLAEIDLRGGLGGITLRIVDREGRRVPNGYVRVQTSGGGASRVEVFRAGEVRLLRAAPVVDLVVQAKGFRAVKLEGVAGDREVVLDRGIRVRLVFADRSVFPGRPVRLRPLLLPADGRTDVLAHECPDLDERGEAVIEAPAPGKYEVDWLVEVDRPLFTMHVNFAPKTKQVIEIADAPGEQVIELTLDAEALAETLERLKD